MPVLPPPPFPARVVIKPVPAAVADFKMIVSRIVERSAVRGRIIDEVSVEA
jgi:hypothetical protein